MPVQILSGLMSRFAEPSGKHYVISDKMRAKILAWICCLCLNLDGGSVECGKIAKDLSMTDAKWAYFGWHDGAGWYFRITVVLKSLGCAVDVASVAEREKMGMTLQEAQANKRAVLKAPVKFPKIGRRGPVKRWGSTLHAGLGIYVYGIAFWQWAAVPLGHRATRRGHI
jgi:DNA-directed RNA polymerase I subunit RPA49